MFDIVKANLNTLSAQVVKKWQINMRYPIAMVFWFISPILWLIPVLIFGTALTGSRYSESLAQVAPTGDIWVFTAIGLTYINFIFGINWASAFAIRQEEFQGTLESIYVTPPYKATLVMANGLYSLSFNGLSLIVQLLFVNWLLGGISLTGIVLSSVYLIMAVLMVQGISMLLSALVLTFKQGWRIVFTIQVMISLITPAQFPLASLPQWMYRIAIHSPFTIAVEGFRNSLLLGYNRSVWSDWLSLFIWGVILFILGLKVYRRQDHRLRKGGKLGKY